MWSADVGPQAIQVSEINSLLTDDLGIYDPAERLKYLRIIQRLDTPERNHLRDLMKRASQ